jgi:hypothetical protein
MTRRLFDLRTQVRRKFDGQNRNHRLFGILSGKRSILSDLGLKRGIARAEFAKGDRRAGVGRARRSRHGLSHMDRTIAEIMLNTLDGVLSTRRLCKCDKGSAARECATRCIYSAHTTTFSKKSERFIMLSGQSEGTSLPRRIEKNTRQCLQVTFRVIAAEQTLVDNLGPAECC